MIFYSADINLMICPDKCVTLVFGGKKILKMTAVIFQDFLD